MARGEDQPPVTVPPPRPDRMARARGYHPRGRTLSDGGWTGAPAVVAPDEDEADEPSRRDEQDERARRDGRGGRDERGGREEPVPTKPARPVAREVQAAGSGDAAPRRLRRPRRARRRVRSAGVADQGRRLRVASVVFLVVLLVFTARLVHFQFSRAGTAEEGLASRLGQVDLPAHRGAIVDRNGEVLAGSVESRFVAADPSRIEQPAEAAAALAPLLHLDYAELLPKLTPHTYDSGAAVEFEYLAREVPVAVGDAVSALGIFGIRVEHDESRVVPGHDLAANVLGFTGRPGERLEGLTGLEAAFDEVLRGVDGTLEFERGGTDGLDYGIPGGYRQETPARSGSDVRLTIDRDLQFEIQRILAERLAAEQADTGAAVVLDVRTGEILAQASYPRYDAADPVAAGSSAWVDNVTGWALDPGSVHKAIVLAACLQEGVVTADSTVLVPSTITKGGVTFTDTHYQAVPTEMTLPGILAWSSNVGTITLADELGAQKLYAYQRAFGLGEPTGIGLPGESAGLVQPPENWSDSSYGSIPIGMGVSVTPLQMAAVYAAIANGGVWVRPHLVQAITTADGVVTPAPAAPTRRVISAENAAALRTMLEAVVTVPGATGLSARLDDYRVAGKTGTGKVVVDGHYTDGEVGSFIGMAPADAPRYVIAVFAHTPGGEGGDVAGPAFAEMMDFTLTHYRVAPTGSVAPALSVYP